MMNMNPFLDRYREDLVSFLSKLAVRSPDAPCSSRDARLAYLPARAFSCTHAHTNADRSGCGGAERESTLGGRQPATAAPARRRGAFNSAPQVRGRFGFGSARAGSVGRVHEGAGRVPRHLPATERRPPSHSNSVGTREASPCRVRVRPYCRISGTLTSNRML
jgi:hypothetical protein